MARGTYAKIAVFMTGILMTCAGTGLAQTNAMPASRPGGDPVLKLGEILVTADRETRDLLATPGVESVSLDIATSTVDGKDIRIFDAGTMTDALDLAPGVFTETRGRKEKKLSSVRGQIYPYPDYALNGIWQRAFWEIPAFFPAAAIDRIEVLRSGGAIMVGPNSGLVGAINIVPRRFDETETIFDIQGGSHETERSSLVHGSRFDRGDYTAGASHYKTEGPDGQNAGEEFSSIFGAMGYDAAAGIHMELTAFGLLGYREIRKIQDPGQKQLRNRTERFDRIGSYGALLRTLAAHKDRSSTELDFGYAARRQDYVSEQTGRPVTKNNEDDWEYNAGLLHARELSRDNTFRIWFQYNHWVCPNGKRHFAGQEMDVQTISGVMMDEQRWDRLTMDGGVRVTRNYYDRYADVTFDITGSKLSSREITDEWDDPTVTGTLGAKYDVARGMALYAHGAVGSVDAPPGAVSETGASLDRETREIFDCGVTLASKAVGTVSVGGFATLRQDAIVLTDTKTTDAGDTFNTYANSDVRQYGLELEGRSAPIVGPVTLFGSVTVMDSEQSVDGGWTDYREIPDVIAAAGFNAESGMFDINLFAKYVSEYENKRFADDGQYHKLGQFLDLNLTGGVSLGKDRATRLYASLENLLDDEYSTVVGYPDYGFQAFAGLSHKF